ncbi:hypothetical protein FHL15_002162 [Xylaria flabelliformis]|uniref:Aminoglycoside phosphotransferase domain-containing protein n=1 Tax=Xylaria flabelliformis TaxID=2512241 RepID=A0A553I9G9_9PEZI|nr:hypothetical protein FHL15_002162 [Xylaria flabelliformis]
MNSALHTCLTNEDIVAIYESGDRAKLQDLNSVRRKAGKEVISKLLATINCDALRARAETLRNGVKCTVNLPPPDQAYFNFEVHGGCNYHGSIVFEDGKTWLARFRLPNHNEPPLQERNFDRRSEFATYRFLAKTAIPVPQVYDCADDEDPMNLIGAGYILLEKLVGKPLEWHEASEVQKAKFSRQLADIYANLEQHPLDRLGRLQLLSTGLPEVGPAFFDYDSDGNLIPFGPFSHSNEYYKALIQQKIQLIKTGEAATSAPLDQYLVCMSLLDSLPPNESGPFFLRHVDSRDANFLVDDDYNITGMIDWELAISTSKGSAFQSPLLLYNIGELYGEGLSTPSEDEKRLSKILREEKGAVELSALAEKKLHFRVEQVIEADPWGREQFESLFSGWWKVTNGVETFDWATWYKKALDMYGDGGFKNHT